MISVKTPSFVLRFDPYLDKLNMQTLQSNSRIWGGTGAQTRAVCASLITEGLARPTAVRKALAELDERDRATLAIVKEHGGALSMSELTTILLAYGYTVSDSDNNHYRNSSIAALLNQGYLMQGPAIPVTRVSYGYYQNQTPVTIFTDERLLEQIDWQVAVKPLPISPATVGPESATFRHSQTVMLDLISSVRCRKARGSLPCAICSPKSMRGWVRR